MTKEQYLNQNTYDFFEKYAHLMKDTELNIQYPDLGISRVECPDYYYTGMENALNLFYSVLMRKIDKIMDRLKIPFIKTICRHHTYDSPHVRYYVFIKDGEFVVPPKGEVLPLSDIKVRLIFSSFINDINFPVKKQLEFGYRLAKEEVFPFSLPIKVEVADYLSKILKPKSPEIYLFEDEERVIEFTQRIENLLFDENGKPLKNTYKKLKKYLEDNGI